MSRQPPPAKTLPPPPPKVRPPPPTHFPSTPSPPPSSTQPQLPTRTRTAPSTQSPTSPPSPLFPSHSQDSPPRPQNQNQNLPIFTFLARNRDHFESPKPPPSKSPPPPTPKLSPPVAHPPTPPRNPALPLPPSPRPPPPPQPTPILGDSVFFTTLLRAFLLQAEEDSPLLQGTQHLLSNAIDSKPLYDAFLAGVKPKLPLASTSANLSVLTILTNTARVADARAVQIALDFLQPKVPVVLRDAATTLMGELSRTVLKDVVEALARTIAGIKSDETARSTAVVLLGFSTVCLPVEGIEANQTVLFVNAVESAMVTAQRSVLRRSLCTLLDGLMSHGLGRATSVVVTQLEEVYSRMIDLLRKWKSPKVPTGLVSARLSSQTDTLYGISVRQQLNFLMPQVAAAKDHPKRLKALEALADLADGALASLPPTHPQIPLIVDEFLAKAVIPKAVYQRSKFVSSLEVVHFHKVFRHPVVYNNPLCLDFLSGAFELPHDIRAVVIQHVPPALVLPVAAVDGITDVLRGTASVIGLMMDPANVWAIDIFPDSFALDLSAHDATAKRIVDAAHSPVPAIRAEARKALLRDARHFSRRFFPFLQQFLLATLDDETSPSEADFVSSLVDAATAAGDPAPPSLADHLMRRVFALFITLDAAAVSSGQRLAQLLTRTSFAATDAALLSTSFPTVDRRKLDHFALKHHSLPFIRSLSDTHAASLSPKTPNDILRFLFATAETDQGILLSTVMAAYNEGEEWALDAVHSILPHSSVVIVNAVASSVLENKKKKPPLELITAFVSTPLDHYRSTPQLIVLLRQVMDQWYALGDAALQRPQIIGVLSRIVSFESTLQAPRIDDALYTFVAQFVANTTVHHSLLDIMRHVTRHAHLTSLMDVLTTLEQLFTTNQDVALECLCNLLARNTDLLATALQRSFLARDVAEMYFRAVLHAIGASTSANFYELISYALVLSAKNPFWFFELLKRNRLFDVDWLIGSPCGAAWCSSVMQKLASQFRRDSPAIIRGALQFHHLLSLAEYRSFITNMQHWLRSAAELDLEETISVMVDMTSISLQLDAELFAVWSMVTSGCEAQIDRILNVLVNRAANNEQSIPQIGRIFSFIAANTALAERIFTRLFSGIMPLPDIPPSISAFSTLLPRFPSASETLHFVLLSFVASSLSRTVLDSLPTLIVLSLLFYSPLTSNNEIDKYARQILSIFVVPLQESTPKSAISLMELAVALQHFGINEQTQSLLLRCCCSFQTDVAINALDIFLQLIPHPADAQKTLALIAIRALMLGEVQLLESVIYISHEASYGALCQCAVNLPIFLVFQQAGKVVPVEFIDVETLARAASRIETIEVVVDVTRPCRGVKAWLGKFVALAMHKKSVDADVVRGAVEEFGRETVVRLLTIVAEGTSVAAIAARQRLLEMPFETVDGHLARIVVKGLFCEETTHASAVFLTDHHVRCPIVKAETSDVLFDGVSHEQLSEMAVKALLKFAEIAEVNVGDHNHVKKTILDHPIDSKHFKTPYSL